jgi:hypothetical protein
VVENESPESGEASREEGTASGAGLGTGGAMKLREELLVGHE